MDMRLLCILIVQLLFVIKQPNTANITNDEHHRNNSRWCFLLFIFNCYFMEWIILDYYQGE